MDVETEFYWYQNNGVVLRSQPKQKNQTSHIAYPTKNELCILYSQNYFSYIVAGDEYLKSPLPEITCDVKINEAACVLNSFANKSGKRGVGAICDETEVVVVGAKELADMNGAKNDDNLFMLASASCLCQKKTPKKPAKDQMCYYHPTCQKMASICGSWHLGGPLYHLLAENFPS
jgi:hypothetical protein